MDIWFYNTTYRKSRLELFCKNDVLKNFAKFTGKHLCYSLFLNKVAGLSLAALSKKRLWYRCFPVNFGKFSRALFYIKYLWWLLLYLQNRNKHDNFLDFGISSMGSIYHLSKMLFSKISFLKFIPEVSC